MFGIDGKDKVVCFDTKFVFLLRTVVEIQCLELTLFYFGFERLCFQGPTFIHNNSTHSQVFHFKICGKSVLYKVKRCAKFYFLTYKSH